MRHITEFCISARPRFLLMIGDDGVDGNADIVKSQLVTLASIPYLSLLTKVHSFFMVFLALSDRFLANFTINIIVKDHELAL